MMSDTLTAPGFFCKWSITGKGQFFMPWHSAQIVGFRKGRIFGTNDEVSYIEIACSGHNANMPLYVTEDMPNYVAVRDWIMRQDVGNPANIELQNENERFRQQIKELQQRVLELELSPGPGTAYLEAEEHFNASK